MLLYRKDQSNPGLLLSGIMLVGFQRLIPPLLFWITALPQPPSSRSRTASSSSWWRWTLRTPEWEGSCLNALLPTVSSIPVLSSLAGSLLPSGVMTWGTGSFSPSTWHWGNGGISWRVRSSHFLSGRTIRTWATSSQRNVSTFRSFKFSLSYRPGSRKTKPDALSRLHSVEEESTEPAPILPPTCFVAALKWESEAYVTLAQARGLCHPGPGPSGWPALQVGCSFRSSKTFTKPRAGLLLLLPIPSRPWSHTALDFVTGLPPSRGKTWKVLEGSPFHPTRAPLRERDRGAPDGPGLTYSRPPFWHRHRPGSPVLLPGVARIPHDSGIHG